MKITILGSCRQDSLYNKYDITSIKNRISYPHYSIEILEVIQYCKHGHISPEETKSVFRTPMTEQRRLNYSDRFLTELNETDLFVIEIASKTSYEYNGRFVHQVLHDRQMKPGIVVRTMSDQEIEADILQMREELNHKPILIVSHISTYENSKRNQLVQLLEKICSKHDIPFLNPMKEFTKRGHEIRNLIISEEPLHHYNSLGHDKIAEIYDDFIRDIFGSSSEY
jgi:hypothetical protein